jgi:cytolysin (calcineurin-like family phosphatase)
MAQEQPTACATEVPDMAKRPQNHRADWTRQEVKAFRRERKHADACHWPEVGANSRFEQLRTDYEVSNENAVTCPRSATRPAGSKEAELECLTRLCLAA